MSKALDPSVRLSIVATCIGLAASCALAQESGSGSPREFAQAAASSDQFEILEAQAVLGQSRNPEVREFAARILQDHQQLSQAVREAAVRAGLEPPQMAMTADQAQWLGALQSAGGPEFDGLFLRQQTLAHRSALAVDQRYATAGQDPGLRQWARDAIPKLSSHAAMASGIEAKLGGRP